MMPPVIATKKLVASIEQKIILNSVNEMNERAQGGLSRSRFQPWEWNP